MTKLDEAVKLLKTLKQDAKLALSGDWDRSDSGFEAQIQRIDEVLELKDDKPKSKFKQQKLFK